MKKFLAPIAALVLLTASAFTVIAVQNWKIADGYNITFSADEASGVFKGFKGTIAFDDANPATGSFNVAIDVNSINTGNGLQNKHAKSDEWFDATKYPAITFVSKSFAKTASGYQVTGDLSVHGITKSTTLPFTFKKTATGGTFAGTFTINRNDFKIGKPGGEVSDNIKVEVSIPVTK